jgi:hypothetical protein
MEKVRSLANQVVHDAQSIEHLCSGRCHSITPASHATDASHISSSSESSAITQDSRHTQTGTQSIKVKSVVYRAESSVFLWVAEQAGRDSE